MSAPFYKFGAFGDEASLVAAFLIGIGFGFFLERAGFGSARKLVSQFYLDDLAVFKVMFTAIVTAMLGVTYLAWAGFLDLSLVYLVPTYWVAQVVGGLLLGVGFVVGGYCPGTSIVATATGKLDGLVVRPRLRRGHARLRRRVPVGEGPLPRGRRRAEDAAGGHRPAARCPGVRGGAHGGRRLRRRDVGRGLDGAAQRPHRRGPSAVGGDRGTLAVEPHPQPEARDPRARPGPRRRVRDRHPGADRARAREGPAHVGREARRSRDAAGARRRGSSRAGPTIA